MIRNTLLCTLAVCGVARAARADVPPPPDGAAPATAADGLDPPVPAVADPLAEPLATPSRNAAPPAPATITTRYARWTLTADGLNARRVPADGARRGALHPGRHQPEHRPEHECAPSHDPANCCFLP